MRLIKRKNLSTGQAAFAALPWLPPDLCGSLDAILPFLAASFHPELARIALYGSWQRGEASPASDVDLAVFLTPEVPWFDAEQGTVNRREARKARRRWAAIEKKANRCKLDQRLYSIAVVTPGMLVYYASHGPVHLQNWVAALERSVLLWEET